MSDLDRLVEESLDHQADDRYPIVVMIEPGTEVRVIHKSEVPRGEVRIVVHPDQSVVIEPED